MNSQDEGSQTAASDSIVGGTLRADRRTVLKLLGAGVASIPALGSARASNGDNAGRPQLSVGSPDCGTLALSYDVGKPPIQVFVEGPTSKTVELPTPGGDRTVDLDVDPGEYQVTAKPGEEGTDGNPAVVVSGSPVTVNTCAASVQGLLVRELYGPSFPGTYEPYVRGSSSGTCVEGGVVGFLQLPRQNNNPPRQIVVRIPGASLAELYGLIPSGKFTIRRASGKECGYDRVEITQI